MVSLLDLIPSTPLCLCPASHRRHPSRADPVVSRSARMSERTTRRAAVAVGVRWPPSRSRTSSCWCSGARRSTTPLAISCFGMRHRDRRRCFYVAIGLLIAVRARNVIGWFLVTVGFCYGLLAFGNAYAAVGTGHDPGSLPAVERGLDRAQPVGARAFVALALLLLLFPDGRPPSPRWRPVLWMAIGGAVRATSCPSSRSPRSNPSSDDLPEPVRRPEPQLVRRSRARVAAWVTVIGVVGCFVALILRPPRGPRLRQQINGELVAPAGGCVLLISSRACRVQLRRVGRRGRVVHGLVFILLVGLPAAITVALFRYRLYDLDLVVSKALVYGILAALFTARVRRARDRRGHDRRRPLELVPDDR